MSTVTAETGSRWKETSQIVCAIVVLSAFFWLCKPGFLGRGNGDGGVMGFFRSAADDNEFSQNDCQWCADADDEALEMDYPGILSMPSCADLAESIKVLQEARSVLLKSTSEGDAQTVRAAKTEYCDAIQEVQAGFTKLKTRVPPDDFSGVCEGLLSLCGADRQRLMAVELVHLEQDCWQ